MRPLFALAYFVALVGCAVCVADPPDPSPTPGHSDGPSGSQAAPESTTALPQGCEYLYATKGVPIAVVCQDGRFWTYTGDPAPKNLVDPAPERY